MDDEGGNDERCERRAFRRQLLSRTGEAHGRQGEERQKERPRNDEDHSTQIQRPSAVGRVEEDPRRVRRQVLGVLARMVDDVAPRLALELTVLREQWVVGVRREERPVRGEPLPLEHVARAVPVAAVGSVRRAHPVQRQAPARSPTGTVAR